MRRAVVAVAVAVAAGAAARPAAPAARGAEEVQVTMSGRLFAPARLNVLTGTRVAWRNQDTSTHTVSSRSDLFDSGRLAPGGQFARRFDTVGSFEYFCRIHRSMRGVVAVAAVALEAPARPVAPGRVAVLEGLAPAAGADVVLERLERDGPVAVLHGVADAERAFAFSVVSHRPALYQARVGTLVSPRVAVRVGPEIRLAVRRTGRSVSVRVHAVPPQPGALVLLERHERERFGFVRLRKARLDGSSRARFALRTARRLRLRVRLARPVGGFARAVSPQRTVAGLSGRRPGAERHRGHGSNGRGS